MDIYQRNFLFGADNVDSVRTLITNALNEHGSRVLSAGKPWVSFGDAVQAILDHQSICMPASILLLTKAAIKNGVPEAEKKPGTDNQFSVRIAPSSGAGATSSRSEPDFSGADTVGLIRAWLHPHGKRDDSRRDRLMGWLSKDTQDPQLQNGSIADLLTRNGPWLESARSRAIRDLGMLHDLLSAIGSPAL